MLLSCGYPNLKPPDRHATEGVGSNPCLPIPAITTDGRKLPTNRILEECIPKVSSKDRLSPMNHSNIIPAGLCKPYKECVTNAT